MARQRMIKPEFWVDEKLIECSLSARLLFIGTWNFADDSGNLQRSSKKLKMQVFPADDVNCEALVVELINHGLLIEYSVNGENFLHIKGFSKHQTINRPSSSSIPALPFSEDSVSAHVSVNDSSVTTQPEEKRREKKETYSAALHLVSLGVDKKIADDWLKTRKLKKLASTETAINAVVNEANKSGKSLADVIRICCEQGWGGFKASWELPTSTAASGQSLREMCV